MNPLNYWYEIISYHETRNDANIEESTLHELYNVGRNDNYFNRCKQTKNGFTTVGKISVKNKFGVTMQVSKDDERYLNGDLKHVNSGKITVMDKNGVTVKVSIDDERFLNGELIGARAKWLTIEGEVMSPTIATKKYNIHQNTVLNRVKSFNPKWSEWKFL